MKSGRIRKILITGCTGLVGHGVTSYFLESGYSVRGTSRRRVISKHPEFSAEILDLRSTTADRWKRVISEVEAIVHCAAAMPSAKSLSDDQYYQANVLGTLAMLEAVQEVSPTMPVVNISGTGLFKAVGNELSEESPAFPRNAYLASKYCAEVVCDQKRLEHDLKVKTLRIKAPYGYRPTAMAVIPKFLEAAAESKDITLWGSGSREQTFTFVEDIAMACELALTSEKVGTWIVAGTKCSTMKETAETVLSLFPESRSRIIFSGEADSQEGARDQVSTTKARLDLGFTARYDLRLGLEKIVKKAGLDFYAIPVSQ